MWDTWDTTHSFAICSREADQEELYFYIGGTHGTQLTLLRFVEKRQIKLNCISIYVGHMGQGTTHSVAICRKHADQVEMYFYIGGTHGTQLTLLPLVEEKHIKKSCTSI
jgi:hypothetical protein